MRYYNIISGIARARVVVARAYPWETRFPKLNELEEEVNFKSEEVIFSMLEDKVRS